MAVVRLSINVAELISKQTQQESKIDRLIEKIEDNHEATRKMIGDLRSELKNEFASKSDLFAMSKDVEGVRKDTDSNTSNMNKVAMLIIGAIITGAIGLLFTFAQR